MGWRKKTDIANLAVHWRQLRTPKCRNTEPCQVWIVFLICAMDKDRYSRCLAHLNPHTIQHDCCYTSAMVALCVSLQAGFLKDSWFWLLNNSQHAPKALYKFLSGLGVACPVPSARCPCHRQHSLVGTITNFQQKKTEGPWALISHPTPGKYFYLVKLEVIVMKCIDKRGLQRCYPY